MTQVFRQNPDNPCQLQQSDDGGVTWTLAFDYEMCSNLANAEKVLEDGINEIYRILGEYDGTLGSIAPDMVYDSTATDDVRDLALCHATKEIVDVICEMELERRRLGISAINAGIGGGGIAGLIAAVLAAPTGGGSLAVYAAVVALGVGVAQVGTATFSAASDSVLQNDEARDLVACCMYDALKGQNLTQTLFEQSLDVCGFTGGTNEAELAGAIAYLLVEDNVYQTFINRLQWGYKYADLGLVDCPCDAEWDEEFDFTQVDGLSDGWEISNNQYPAWGHRAHGTGWTVDDNPPYQALTLQNYQASKYQITRLEVNGSNALGDNQFVQIINSGVTVASQNGLLPYDIQLASAQEADNIKIVLANVNATPVVSSVKIYGKGANPFE